LTVVSQALTAKLMAGWRSVACLGFALLLSACATTPPLSGALSGTERHGRFALKATSPFEEPKAIQGNFLWQQTTDGWVLFLKSPMGATLAKLSVDAAGATLQRTDAPDQRANSPTVLMRQTLGEAVPVDALSDWIGGRLGDRANIAGVVRDDQGRVTAFEQQGWQVNFARYDSVGPTRMTLSTQAQGRDVVLRLVIN